MTAYFIVSYRITDPVGYEPFVPAVIPILQASVFEILLDQAPIKRQTR